MKRLRALPSCHFNGPENVSSTEAWSVPTEDDTFDRLQRFRLPRETDDDLLMRLIRSHRGQQTS